MTYLVTCPACLILPARARGYIAGPLGPGRGFIISQRRLRGSIPYDIRELPNLARLHETARIADAYADSQANLIERGG